jgi:hypothetical protein
MPIVYACVSVVALQVPMMTILHHSRVAPEAREGPLVSRQAVVLTWGQAGYSIAPKDCLSHDVDDTAWLNCSAWSRFAADGTPDFCLFQTLASSPLWIQGLLFSL